MIHLQKKNVQLAALGEWGGGSSTYHLEKEPRFCTIPLKPPLSGIWSHRTHRRSGSADGKGGMSGRGGTERHTNSSSRRRKRSDGLRAPAQEEVGFIAQDLTTRRSHGPPRCRGGIARLRRRGHGCRWVRPPCSCRLFALA